MSSEPALLYEKRDGIAVLTMNRPAVRNALNAEMLCRLADAWQDVQDDPAVRVAILTGAGEDAFCAGADLDRLVRMMQGLRPPETEFDQRILQDYQLIYKGLLRNFEVTKPIVAAVKGFCVAGGTEILQTTDIRVAAEDARFAIAEVKWSLFPMGGSTVRLPRQIPYCRAMEILLTGEQFSAEDALAWGLVNRVVPAAEVMAEARRYAEVIVGNGPLAVQAVKRSVLAGLGRPTAEALEKGDGDRHPGLHVRGRARGDEGVQGEAQAGVQGALSAVLVNLSVLQDLIARHLADREAVVWRERVLTYAGLLARSQRFGRALRRHGRGGRSERSARHSWESGQDHLAVYCYNGPGGSRRCTGRGRPAPPSSTSTTATSPRSSPMSSPWPTRVRSSTTRPSRPCSRRSGTTCRSSAT
jgi:enoyl-CoA hydratase